MMTDNTSDRDAELDALWARLQGRMDAHDPRRLWQSWGEFEPTGDLRAWAASEFEASQSTTLNGSTRREFLQLMGAALVMAGAAGCSRPPRGNVVPYVKAPEAQIPGKPAYYASAFVLGGFATGVLVESHAGRPTKLEGNPDHPASLGATDALAQAATWSLYDPQRSQAILRKSAGAELASQKAAGPVFVPRDWDAFRSELRRRLWVDGQRQGAGLRILTETTTSPTLAAQLSQLLRDFPGARWHQWSPINRDQVLAGTRKAFGAPHFVRYDLSRADVILAVESDFLCQGPARLAYARAWAKKRAVRRLNPTQNRLYAVESALTPTGSKADHRLAMNPGRMESFLRALARGLGVAGLRSLTRVPGALAATPFEPSAREASWLDALVEDLRAHPGRCVVIVGPTQPAQTHALAHAINAHLHNIGATVEFTQPVLARPDSQLDSMRTLTREMRAGRVHNLLILGGNPVYDAPADLDFGGALEKVEWSARLGLYVDETSQRCTWHLPQLHFLEEWSDARAFDGTISLIQPLVAPLYHGHSSHEVLDLLGGVERGAPRDNYMVLKDAWRARFGAQDFDHRWRQSLLDGVVSGSRLEAVPVQLREDFDQSQTGGVLEAGAWRAGASAPDAESVTVIFAADPSVWDGRFANNAMLQELPRPFSTLCWDNVAMISVRSAQKLGLKTRDRVRLRMGARELDAPVWVAPGHADGCVTLHLGYGRRADLLLSKGIGFDAYRIRNAGALSFEDGWRVEKTGEQHSLAMTQMHHRMHEQPVVQRATLHEFRNPPPADPAQLAAQHRRAKQSLFADYSYDSYAWGMSIDLTLCTACQACVAACQAENNIPVVGKKQVEVSREMHWIRVDTYYEGDPDNPTAFHQPVPCMHCERAPCEVVCPVEATSHSGEGINEMTYNRCVGTRYCSNNCPYKVRRFNFLDYSELDPADTGSTSGAPQYKAALDLRFNPDVTVRSRGVMEKCTYCIQRINAARAAAQIDGRRIHDDDFRTACEQVCPTQAIIFGDTNNPNARVTHRKAEPHDYALLAHLNTRPRTTYLSAIYNPNPQLQE